MAIKYVHGDDANDPTLDRTKLREGWNMRRGKVTPKARACWGQLDGDKKALDPTVARQVLDEAER